jgi:hypothetical protein
MAPTRQSLRRFFVLLVSIALMLVSVPALPQTATDGTKARRGPEPRFIGSNGAGVTGSHPAGPVDHDPPARAFRGAAPHIDGGSPPRVEESVAPTAAVTTRFAGMHQVCRIDRDPLCPGAAQYNGTFPPDTTLARSSNRVVELVNSRARLFNSSGGVIQTTTLNSLLGAVDEFGRPAGPVLFDPKVIYDRNSAYPRFYALALAGLGTSDQSRIYVAVSRSPDPSSLSSSNWCRYYVSGNLDFGSTRTWADFPSLGVGARALVVSTNQYSVSPAQFQGAALWAWDKLRLNNNAVACPAMQAPYLWKNYLSGGISTRLPFTMSVTQHYTLPTSFTNAQTPTYLTNSKLGTAQYELWRIINIASGSPLLQGPLSRAGNWTNNNPTSAPGGSGAPIDTGSANVLQVAGIGNRLFAGNTTRCQFGPSTSLPESCVRLVRFFVGNNSTGGFAATLEQQTVLGGGENWWYFYPSVAANNAGTVASTFNAVSTGGYMGTAWATKPYASANYGGATWLGQGNCLRDATYHAGDQRNHYRAGDYSGAAADPDGIRLWVAGERSAQISGLGCGWQTWIGGITL